MTQWHELPPGPERRELMLARGRNTSPEDYTAEENAALAAQAAQALEVLKTSAQPLS